MAPVCKTPEAKRELEAFYDRFLALVPDPQTRWVPTRFGETHLLVAGNPNGPPVLLLHGAFTGSAHMVSACGPLLERFRVYAPDMFGQSVKSIDDVRLDYKGPACGQWIRDVMDAAGLARAHVYGASLGGFMARKLAEHAPERVDRMVLNVPAGIVTAGVTSILSRFFIPKLLHRAFPSPARLQRLVGGMMSTPDALWTAYLDAAFRGFSLETRMPPPATPEDLAHFDRPTLVFGAADDIFFPGAPLLARAKQLFQNVEIELLEDCRHMLPDTAAFRAEHRARVERFFGVDALRNAA